MYSYSVCVCIYSYVGDFLSCQMICTGVLLQRCLLYQRYLSEIFIFLYVGMDALDIEKWKVVSQRAASVFPLSFLTNLTKKCKCDKIEFKQQVIVWWAGLMRGAVSVALADNQFKCGTIK
ncbi:hypothetical protein Pint_01061 [Pistacia integerrima]|uniref:Uncharacterized protein n=1 Tax=Pistacia integerrima TaxID=434235 RepID=A0ACC0ZJ55_9ROSI|nr:hypothetical protein Pint_01061 [Pistacia integerrima]